MSLVGQQPAPSRVDGFWVTMVSPNEYARQERMEKPVTDEELETLIRWGKVLLQESRPYEEKRQQVCRERDRMWATAQAVYTTNYTALAIGEKTHLREVSVNADNEKLLMDLQAHGFDVSLLNKAGQQLREKLNADKSLSAAERDRLQSLLYQYPPATFNQATEVPVSARPKADPVENSIRLLQESSK